MKTCTRKSDGQKFQYVAWDGDNLEEVRELFSGGDQAYKVYARSAYVSTLILETWGPKNTLEESRFVLSGDYIVREQNRPKVLMPSMFDEQYDFPGELYEEPFRRFLNLVRSDEETFKSWKDVRDNKTTAAGNNYFTPHYATRGIDEFLREQGNLLYPLAEALESQNRGQWWEDNDPYIFEIDIDFGTEDLEELQGLIDGDQQRVYATFCTDPFSGDAEVLEVFVRNIVTGNQDYYAIEGDSFIILDGLIVGVEEF